MVPVTPPFPLFKLPYLAWRNVLATMHIFDLLKSSLCSKALKRQIRSLFRKPSDLKISFGRDGLGMTVRAWVQNIKLDPINFLLEGPSSLHTSKYISSWSGRSAEHIPSSSNVKDWVIFLMEALNLDRIGLRFDCDKFDIERVQWIVEGLKIQRLHLEWDISNAYLLRALETFLPTNDLCLRKRPVMEQSLFRDIISRDYEGITLQIPMSLEEVLLLNSEIILLGSLSASDFNTLLKKWIGGWNPKLRGALVNVTFNTEDHLPAIFDGVKYQESPENGKRQGMKYPIFDYEIKRDDGTMAIIQIHRRERHANQRAIQFTSKHT